MAKQSQVFSSSRIIIAILALGLALRLYGGFGSWLFTYDQARDAFYVADILAGQLKIVGPPTDLPGVFHGPLYYYFLAPWYWLGAGRPEMAMFAVALVNVLTIIPVYFLVRCMTTRAWATVAAILCAVSFEAVNYGQWLSNPTLVVPAFAMYVWGLWQLVEKKSSGWIWTAVGLGISIQSQLFMLYLLPVTCLFVIIYRPPLRHRHFLVGLIILTGLLSSFAIAEIKFGFQGVSGLLKFFVHG